ncbi:F0F1 ATP synthase subunit A [Tropheryma whipplei]|uniref:ATP synthase subunit a n=1 Tax=Tropheryma whipplei (strain Twist) TaxID=203267 RepID=Q83G85_TROWT|nr:F0F1 ATP synthase subunit A [Tropheryma whipplei]AAO44527.1 ATP synthase A chain [Tropheryma whipplei str. Twist]MCO8182308.1 F0F1 ATP synthase subunit A [Tropheryma whipplei]MCO8190077.1 F0F1 ATP synthase subunit A [Tropheryma whipplei]CAD67010.1 ATP synthase A chain [Tropheryma whipplei TW08/27]
MSIVFSGGGLLLSDSCQAGEFCGPSVEEFAPSALLFHGTFLEVNRIILIRFLAVGLIIAFFWLSLRRPKPVPGKFQSLIELCLEFVRKNIAEDILGKDAHRFLPLLTGIFFLTLSMNIMGIIPGLNIAGTSVIGLPLVMALVASVSFVYAGFKRHGFRYMSMTLFPAGVPRPLYILVAPIEFLSVFILRPITLTLRLTMNMMAGHLLLVLCFLATDFLFFTVGGAFAVLGIGTLLIGLAFTLFEIAVCFLQAYIFTLLTGVYIELSLADEH